MSNFLKKTILFCSFLITCALVTVCKSQVKTFFDPDDVYSISYPDNWKEKYIADKKTVTLNPPIIDKTGSYYFIIKTEKLNEKLKQTTVREIATIEPSSNKIEKLAGTSYFVNTSFIIVNRQEWWIYETVATKPYYMHERTWKTTHNGSTYSIIYNTISEKKDIFNDFLFIADPIFRTFRFFQKDSAVYQNFNSINNNSSAKDTSTIISTAETSSSSNTAGTTTYSKHLPWLQQEKDEELSLAASLLFSTVYKYNSANSIASGETVKLDMSNKDKNKLVENSGLMLNTDNSSFIDKQVKVPFKVSVEVCDLNDDGLFELIIKKYNQTGPQRTNPFSIFRKPTNADMGMLSSNISYREILKGFGVPLIQEKTVKGYHSIVVDKLDGITGLSYDYIGYYDYAGQVLLSDKKGNPYLNDLVGGDSPDELGRNLLKALQTNDKKLWISCLHPVDIRERSRLENSFQLHREAFNQVGLTQWNLVKFSRVAFFREESNHDPLNAGEKSAYLFRIEFTYKNQEYLGITSNMRVKTYNNQKYFVYSTGIACQVDLSRYRKPQ